MQKHKITELHFIFDESGCCLLDVCKDEDYISIINKLIAAGSVGCQGNLRDPVFTDVIVASEATSILMNYSSMLNRVILIFEDLGPLQGIYLLSEKPKSMSCPCLSTDDCCHMFWLGDADNYSLRKIKKLLKEA